MTEKLEWYVRTAYADGNDARVILSGPMTLSDAGRHLLDRFAEPDVLTQSMVRAADALPELLPHQTRRGSP